MQKIQYDLSLVLPVYNEAESIKAVHEELAGVLQQMELSYEIIYVDDVTISVGRHGVTNYKQHPAWQKEYFLYRNAAPQTKAIQITAASAAPTSGEYLVGDIIFNDSAAASGKIGWVCTTAGTAGSGAVFKPFGAIDA